jgi:hypothetical protein
VRVVPPAGSSIETKDADAADKATEENRSAEQKPSNEEPTTETPPTTDAQKVEVVDAKVEDTPPPAVEPEDLILQDLDVPADIRNFRTSHIGGTLLAYVQSKIDFDKCIATKCPEQLKLLEKATANKVGPWKKPDGCEGDACFQGTVTVTKPSKLDRADCPYLIDVTEVLLHAGKERKQERKYCTENGFNRKVESWGPVT